MKTINSLKIVVVLLFSLLVNTVQSQGYNFTLVQNSDYNYTISAVSNFNSGSFQPITQSYGFTLVLPDGVTITVNDFFPSGTNGTTTPVQGSAVAGIDPSMSDKDIFLITTDTAGLTFSSHTSGATIPLVTLTINGNPSLGEIRLLNNNSTLASSPAINGAFDGFIQVDIIDDTTVDFNNEFIDFTGDEFFSFETLSLIENEISSFTIYPNPTTKNVYINGIEKIKLIEIFTINGQRVLRQDTNLDVIDVSKLETAIYLVKLTTSTATQTIKLVKN